MTEGTPGIPLTPRSPRLRTGSQAWTTAAFTVMEKNTLPSATRMSDRTPVLGSGSPSGLLTPSRLARTPLLVNAILCSVTTAGQTPRGQMTGYNIRTADERSTDGGPRPNQGSGGISGVDW